MTTLAELLVDLDAEYDALRAVVGGLADDAPEWDLATPAEGWAVRDQISHLAYFDDAGRLAMVDPDAFARTVDEVLASTGDPMEVHLARGRAMGGTGLLAWWGTAHREMVAAFSSADPSARVPWFGPPMGVLSFISARLMETWAHGQDVCDALGVQRAATPRLAHIAHLGVRARPFSYLVRGRDVPPGHIDVVLSGPGGDEWSWVIGGTDDEGGDAGAPEAAGAAVDGGVDPAGGRASVTGSALDFCLVVTQRRNLVDTDLVVSGALAEDWMAIAQAFAGPPGPGRPAA
jgi:uncharacterized protein (TIGR03084 family)